MNLQLDPHSNGWRVMVQIPETDKCVNVGQLERMDENQWRILMTDKQYVFEADSLDAAYAHLLERLQSAQPASEHLHDESMSNYVDMHLQILNAMAGRTSAMRGWVAGIGTALGRFIVEDLPDGHEETFWKQLRDVAEDVRDKVKQHKAWKDDLETMIQHLHRVVRPEEEDQPPSMH